MIAADTNILVRYIPKRIYNSFKTYVPSPFAQIDR